jgi:hypothetical protein
MKNSASSPKTTTTTSAYRSTTPFVVFFVLICFLYISIHFFVHYGESYNNSNKVGIVGSTSSEAGSSSRTRSRSSTSQNKKIGKFDKTMDTGEGGVADDVQKTEWPELVGNTGDEAKKKIERSNPTIKLIQILPENSMMTMDYSTERVRILVNDDNIVTSTPRIG